MNKSQFAIILGAVFVVGISVVAIVRWNLPTDSTSTPRATLDIEIAKAVLTGFVVAVIGIVINGLVKAREERVQAMRLQANLLGEFIQQLGEHYRSVKATRRRLRSFGLTTRYNTPPEKLNDVHLKAYEDAMETIEKTQLALEDFKIRFRMLPLFSDIKDVALELKKMEAYLRAILREREKTLSQIRSGESISFAKLGCLNEFTADADDKALPVPGCEDKHHYRFKPDFDDAYDRIWERISQNLRILTDA
jgi:hypothetical protein